MLEGNRFAIVSSAETEPSLRFVCNQLVGGQPWKNCVRCWRCVGGFYLSCLRIFASLLFSLNTPKSKGLKICILLPFSSLDTPKNKGLNIWIPLSYSRFLLSSCFYIRVLVQVLNKFSHYRCLYCRIPK
ncbi:hypothetical protein L3X38_008330 [Prunus dulcis]|uniref:Uncharacterized protein n=1 Tax=Prunus dulcis TaxID=3755 RepID=A0AAD4ZW77_PRUDU|nr:hypothetical protein L3X38_008330 [Prunus dulcis]